MISAFYESLQKPSPTVDAPTPPHDDELKDGGHSAPQHNGIGIFVQKLYTLAIGNYWVI